jgi:hypothetical protein
MSDPTAVGASRDRRAPDIRWDATVRGVYNKAEYEVQRRHMMQEWSNIVDAWVGGQKYLQILIPPSMPLLQPDPAL